MDTFNKTGIHFNQILDIFLKIPHFNSSTLYLNFFIVARNYIIFLFCISKKTQILP